MALKYDKLLNDYDKHCQRIAKSTTIRINETPAEKVRRMRHLEADYTRWFSYYFPNFAKKPCAWFHKRLANKVIENRHIRALAEWYRSAAKSVHIDMGIPLFLYLVKGDLHYMLLIGETEPKARKLLSSLQAQLQHNQRILNDYGQRFQYGDWADGDFTTVDGVKFTALGFMQSPRGAREDENRPDYIVIDDVDNKRHVNNDRLMREAIEFITEDVWGTFDTDPDATDRFIYANNNFHKTASPTACTSFSCKNSSKPFRTATLQTTISSKSVPSRTSTILPPNGLKKPMPPTGVRSSTTSRTVPSCASSCTFTFRTVPSSVTKISYGDKCFLSKSTMASASTATFPIKPPETTKPCSSLAK